MSALLLILLGFVLGVAVTLVGVAVLVATSILAGVADDEPTAPPPFQRSPNPLSHNTPIASVRVSP